MKVKIVRHHRRAQYSNGDIEHGGIGNDGGRGNEKAVKRRPVIRFGKKHLHAEHAQDGADERDDQRLHVAESPARCISRISSTSSPVMSTP